jgi:hypothetical protein
MTFTEAAIEVLRREGKPLHFKKIAEIAIRESLLDHVGKIPEEVMGGQLADHCRLPRPDRHVMVVQPGTFALVEWGLDEDPQGLEAIVEPPPEGEPSYRGRERHPIPSREMARSLGRGTEARARRREEGEERRAKRFPPPSEVAFEILAGAEKALSLTDIAALGAERLLMPDAFVRDTSALASALSEDNRRRESSGRKALFALEGDVVALVAQPEPGERPAPAAARAPIAAPADVRRAGLASLRRKLRECDPPTVEHVAARLLDALGYRDVKVAKRGREHVVYTGRRKMGLVEVRHGFRILRTGAEIGRRDVAELRRDLGNYGAQIGVVVSAGEATREARSEAALPGQLPVMLLAGEALAEAMAEASVGCRLVVVPEVDEAFFRGAAETAAQEEEARRARREEREARDRREEREPRDRREEREVRDRREEREVRDRREEREPREPREERGEGERERRERRAERAERGERAPREAAPVAEGDGQITVEAIVPAGGRIVEVAAFSEERAAALAAPPEGAADEDDEGDEDDEADEGTADAAGAADRAQAEGEPRRRRRRRRRRGGRGRGERREGAVAAGGAAGGDTAAGAGAPAAEPTAAAEPAPAVAAPGDLVAASPPPPEPATGRAAEGAATPDATARTPPAGEEPS